MRYKLGLSVMIAVVFGLLLTGVALADSVTKTLYVDGAKVGTSTTTQAITFPYPRLTIGSEGNRWYRYNGLVGEIDEFAVYGKVLTDANVAAHYSAGTGGYVAAVNADSPLLYLRFEDAGSGNGSKAANSGSADMNSTYIGAVGQDISGYIGKAAILHGAADGNGDCIDVCDVTGTLSLVDISVEFWIKTTQSSDYPRLFQHNGANTEERSYGAMYNAGTNAVGLIGGGSTGYLNSTLNDGSWHHVVITFNSIKPGPYAAEVKADDPCVYLQFNSQMLQDSSSKDYWAGTNGQYANPNGKCPLIQKTAGSMGMSLYMDNTINDSGYGTYALAYVWNNYGAQFERQGPDTPWTDHSDYYAIVDSTQSQSYEIWIKSVPGLSSSTYAMIWQQIGSYTNEPSVNQPSAPALGIYTDNGVVKLRVAGGNSWYYPGTAAPFDGQWHQLVVTYEPNSDGLGYSLVKQLYLDGSLAGQTTQTDPNGNAKLTNYLKQLIIGCENDQGYGYSCFSGYADEFAIYAGVLSAERVAAHYAAWQPKDCADVKARGLTLPGDLNGDCKVDLDDFAILASQWHLCDNPSGAGCGPNW